MSGLPRRFVGLAAVYGQRTEIGDARAGGFYEEIAAGAFQRALRERDDVRLLVDHNESLLLARTWSGTLTLTADHEGLHARADLPATQLGRDTALMIARKDLSGMSFAWTPRGTIDEWRMQHDGTELRIVRQVGTLWDTSIVTYPAYPGTRAALDWTTTPQRALTPDEQRRQNRDRAAAKQYHAEARTRFRDLERRTRR